MHLCGKGGAVPCRSSFEAGLALRAGVWEKSAGVQSEGAAALCSHGGSFSLSLFLLVTATQSE